MENNIDLSQIKIIKEQIIEEDNFSFKEITLEFNYLIEPYKRHRLTRKYGSSFYDPLSNYKKNIRKKLKEIFKDFKLYSSPIQVEIITYLDLPKNSNQRMILNALLKKTFPKIKPDVDNVAKTTLDLFKNIIWEDDNQVYDLHIKKLFDLESPNRTIIKVRFLLNELENTGRLTKDEKENLTEEQLNFLVLFKKKNKEEI